MASAAPEATPLRVSVVITAWNSERHLGEALESVLAQTHPAAEVIVNDDGSTDGTAAVVRSFGSAVTLLSSPHEGIGAGRNRAIEHATGDLLAFLDADDRWHPRKLEVQVAALRTDPALDAVFVAADEFVDAAGASRHRLPRLGIVGPLVSSLVLRSEAAARVGPFDPTTTLGDWIDWWGRATELGLRVAYLDEVLADRRLHEHNNSVVNGRDAAQYLRVVWERIDRARTQP